MQRGELGALRADVINRARGAFAHIDEVAEINTKKVLDAMRACRVSDAHFSVSFGYAYSDLGREKLDELYARVFGAERALVRTQFVSGTHALAAVLFGILRPGDQLVSITGAPYDTMQTVIGWAHESVGSLKEFGVGYDELPMRDGRVDLDGIDRIVTAQTKMALVQRSRGYSEREPLSIEDIRTVSARIKAANPNCIVFVDNCYGEFVDRMEPTEVPTVDIMAGSLIKNPGGGLAPTGGYIAGRSDLVEAASYRLTAPGMGDELGASLVSNRLLYQGLFLAPHVVAQALKGAVFAAGIFEGLGYRTFPHFTDARSDVIQAIVLGDADRMKAFARAIQAMSPVDSFAAPEPWDMPGYADQIIMAAGTFVQGASIELSADGPMREPYCIYLQGGLTFEHAALGVMAAAEAVR
ncbi:methionine gamma-lyase family protein [Selenomonas noxia]|uniref:methionine gamma-lyase family protein n=1 Tax=Selenomonas noxia TaxID=135083 RepID=UPI0028ED5427|nr:methionine gamma-lyase family protein [Selenomonas noxia]